MEFQLITGKCHQLLTIFETFEISSNFRETLDFLKTLGALPEFSERFVKKNFQNSRKKKIQTNSHLLFHHFSQQVNLPTYEDRYEAQHQVVLIITTLIDFDEAWLASQAEVINALKTIWQNDLYKVSHRIPDLLC